MNKTRRCLPRYKCLEPSAVRQNPFSRIESCLLSAKARTPLNVPTYGEQGYPTLDFNLWHGMLGPKGIPPEIVQRMNAELDAVLKSPEVSERLAADGVFAAGGSSEAFMATLRAEVKRWQDFIQRSGIKLE